MPALLESQTLDCLTPEEKRALLAKLLRERAPQPKLHPASLAQRRLWFISVLDPDSASYNIPCPVRLSGRLDVDALERSFAEVVRRHQTLRTSLVVSEDDGEPLQRVVPELEIPLEIIDLSEREDDAEVDRAILEESTNPFQIAEGPLLRLRLLQLAPKEHILLLTCHHLIADGWSVGVLVREVVTLYQGITSGIEDPRTLLPPLAIQYTDFTRWQTEWLAQGEMDRQMSWWREELRGLRPSMDLPFDRPRPARMQELGATRFWDVSGDFRARLEAWATDRGATLFMVLLATFASLLQRYSGHRDFSVGTPIANRNRSQTERLIGLFVNTLVLRFPVVPEVSLNAVVDTVRKTTLGAYAHQDVPFERLVEELQPTRDLSRSPLFEVMFELQNAPMPAVELDDLSLAVFDVDRSTSLFDLTVGFRPTRTGLKGWVEYNTDLFDHVTAARLEQHLMTLLDAALDAPSKLIHTLPILTPAERHQLVEWNDTDTAYDSEATWEALFARQVERTPEATAAHCNGASLSFRELDCRAGRVASHLAAAGVGPDTAVGLYAARSLEFLVAMAAVWKAGGVYLPLEPAHPPNRLRRILETTFPAVLLVSRRVEDQVSALEDALGAALPPLLWVEEAQELETPKATPVTAPSPDSLSYLIFTSGSTGTPKGAMLHHRGFVNGLFARIDAFGLTAADTLAQTASQSFDISVWQLAATLIFGGQVRIYPDEISKDPTRLGHDLARHRVTIFEAVPAMLRETLPLRSASGAGCLAGLRWLMPTGEAVPPDLCRELHRAYPDVPMMNAYGPAECSDDSIVYPIREELAGDTVPIGYPLANFRIHLLDRQLEPVPIGVLGQIWLAGVGVGRGYAGAAAKNAAAFQPNPFSAAPGERIYGSGDLGRRRHDGAIEFLGRADHQLKIRGSRIELGDIEAALLHHPAVKEAVVVAHDRSASDRRLVAYLAYEESKARLNAADLRQFLGQGLPDYMVPAAFVALDALPLSTNGKVDRKALRPPADADYERRGGRRQAHSPTEELLVGIWEEILQLDEVGMEDNFFDLGGHSLLATQVITRIKVTFGVELAIFTLFEHSTVAELAQMVDKALVGGEILDIDPIQRVPRDQELPLSYAQERLWFLDQFVVDSAAYNMPTALDVRGIVAPSVLARTFAEIVRRHEVLRTVVETAKGRSHQKILPPTPVLLPLVDLSGLPPEPRERARRARIRAEATRPFDLVHGPVLRTTLLRLDQEHHVLLLTLHHIAADGWSLGIFVREVLTIYSALVEGHESPLPEPAVQYADYAVWQREQLSGGMLEQQLDFWRSKLAGAAPVFDLPGRNPLTTRRAGAMRRFHLPETLGQGLRRRGLEHGATLFMVLFAGFEILLYRYSRQRDIVLGTPTGNRSRPEIENLIGFLVNTLALRGDLSGNPTFLDFLSRIRQTSLEAFAHQDLPFEQLVAELNPERELDRSPLFQILFTLENEPQSVLETPDLLFEMSDTFNEDPMFEMSLDIVEQGDDGNTLQCSLIYRSDLFDKALIDRMEKHFGILLQAIVDAPETCLDDLKLLSQAERHQLLLEWNDTGRGFPLHHTFPTHFAEQVGHNPNQIAVTCGEARLTYAQLDLQVALLAHELGARGVGPESRVALLGERSVEFLVAILATFEAGGAYVPLDHHHPTERHRQIVAQAEPDLLLVSPGGTSPAESLDDMVGLPQLRVALAPPTAELPGPRRSTRSDSPDQLAYIIFTSGSTGTPKGAMVTQRGMMNHLFQMIDLCMPDEREVLAQNASQCFDISVWQFLVPLLLGSRVVIYPDAIAHDPVRLSERVEADGVTVLELVPSLLRTMLLEEESRGLRRLGDLHWLIPTGEALPPDLARRWGQVYPHIPFLNAYGPAECSDDVTIKRIEADSIPPGSQAPIGRPLPNLTARILKPYLGPVPALVVGEIFVGGVGVGRGYAGSPRRTASVYLPDPFAAEPGQRMYKSGDLGRLLNDGTLEFAGRVDHQVKIRGLRIELGEIETVLGDHPAVAGAVVVVHGEGTAVRLVAFVTPDPNFPTPEEGMSKLLSHDLKQTLPEYMVPASFQRLDELPTTPNGKVDRKALAAQELVVAETTRAYVPPENEVEEFLAELYEEIFDSEAVGIYDNFFDLGGHSLLATQVVSRVNDAFEIELTLRNFFEAPTVAELAVTVENLVIEELEQLSEDEIDDLEEFDDGTF